MACILAAGLVWGYGALIADTRVIWENGDHVDGLQKIHRVGDCMAAGFAESVTFTVLTTATTKCQNSRRRPIANARIRKRARRCSDSRLSPSFSILSAAAHVLPACVITSTVI